MVCEEVSVYVSWLSFVLAEMRRDGKEKERAKFLELREENIQYGKPTRSASLCGVLCACDGESLADAAD